jgi:Protein of unknown function DUF262/Protein of unknown function (DUF1524)
LKPDATYLLKSLSSNDATFFIPPYQRNYEWKTSTCRVFLEDIRKVAKANQAGGRAEHFFGSVVYVVEDASFGVPAKYVLTDGQQRITTTMLFLMALRDTIVDKAYKETIQKKYIENDSAIGGLEFKIKLKQVETDWEAYRCLALRESVSDENKNSAVYQNYEFFRSELSGTSDLELSNLLEKGLMKFEVITIQLEPISNPWENPQEIFESMNSLGQPLSLADLVRNYLLMGKTSGEQINFYNKFWLPLEKELPGRLSEFIRDWMQSDQHKFFKVAKENNFKELYSSFKELVRNRDTSDVFESLAQFAKPYSQAIGLSTTGNETLDEVISDFSIIGTTTAQSLIAEILQKYHVSNIESSKVVDLLHGLRTYVMRRRILQLATAENKFYPTVGAHVSRFLDSSRPGDELLRHSSNYEYALRLPNNTDVEYRLSEINFYNFGVGKSTPRLLLSMVEENITKARPSKEDDQLQLEHIMPQTLSDSWKRELGSDFESLHVKYVNSIGNITLIRHNQELGNKPFLEKRKVFLSNSGLQVSQNMICRDSRNGGEIQKWGASEIEERTKYLIDIITNKILEVPQDLRHTSNWKQEETRTSNFDSKRVLANLIGETINYVKDPQVTAVVVSNSKVIFEQKEWSLTSLTRELRRRAGEENSSSAYQGAYYWAWDETKLVNLDQ